MQAILFQCDLDPVMKQALGACSDGVQVEMTGKADREGWQESAPCEQVGSLNLKARISALKTGC